MLKQTIVALGLLLIMLSTSAFTSSTTIHHQANNISLSRSVVAQTASIFAPVASAEVPVTTASSAMVNQPNGFPTHPHNAKSGKLLTIYKVYVINGQIASIHKTSSPKPEWWGCSCYYATKVGGVGYRWEYLAAAQGSNPYTTQIMIQILQSISNSYSANVGVSAEVVKAGVGFSVTQTYSVSQRGYATIPYGHTVELDAYAKFYTQGFDVWYSPWLGNNYIVGSGEADEYTGEIDFWSWDVS